MGGPLSITVIVAARNEEANIGFCIASLAPAERVIVVDSGSTDLTADLARRAGAEVVQFEHRGGYPKKRQWALDTIEISTRWTMLVDADERIPESLWDEIEGAIRRHDMDAFLVTKGFHFMGRKFRWGGFSHAAMILFRTGHARFEQAVRDPPEDTDMEVHERLVLHGRKDRLLTPLIHEDFKGLDAYRARHEKYAAWEAQARYEFLESGQWGEGAIKPRLFGDEQERRRFLKTVALHTPCEPLWWFLYHYVIRLGVLEGVPGLIASTIRARYIARVRRLVEAKRRR